MMQISTPPTHASGSPPAEIEAGEAGFKLLGTNRRGRLGVLATSSLLIADVVGTGILALPGAVSTIGFGGGLAFLAAQLPLNLYIGSLLNAAAARVDANQRSDSTSNLVTLSESLYGATAPVARATRYAYVLNLFLVLGNYLVVMSNAVNAMLASDHALCPHQSMLVATSLLFGLNQLPSLSEIGKWPTVISIASVVFVLILCIVGSQAQQTEAEMLTDGAAAEEEDRRL